MAHEEEKLLEGIFALNAQTGLHQDERKEMTEVE